MEIKTFAKFQFSEALGQNVTGNKVLSFQFLGRFLGRFHKKNFFHCICILNITIWVFLISTASFFAVNILCSHTFYFQRTFIQNRKIEDCPIQYSTLQIFDRSSYRKQISMFTIYSKVKKKKNVRKKFFFSKTEFTKFESETVESRYIHNFLLNRLLLPMFVNSPQRIE